MGNGMDGGRVLAYGPNVSGVSAVGVILSMDMLASSMVEYLSIKSGCAMGGDSWLENRCCMRKHSTGARVDMDPFLARLYSGSGDGEVESEVILTALVWDDAILAALLSAFSTRLRS